MPDLDLNVDSPDKVASILRNAASAYQESATELESAWQDRNAGRQWIEVARILERAAAQIARVAGDRP